MGNFSIPEDALRARATKDSMTHLSTGVAVIRDSKVLLVHRESKDFRGGTYELPGGGIDPGENFDQAVRREVLEETGLTVMDIVGMFDGFDYSTDKKPHVRQLNFVVEVEPGDVQLSSEHDGYKWVDETEIENLEMSQEMRICVLNALKFPASRPSFSR